MHAHHWLAAGLIALGCAGSAGAEVKVINGTGQELVIDLLSQRGQVTDVKLPAQPTVELNVGPRSPALETEMLVVKSPDGAEQYRASVESGRIYVIHRWNPYIYTYIGEYQGGQARDAHPRILNGTGIPVKADVSFADFTTSNDWTIPGPDQNNNCNYLSVGAARTAGEVVDVTLKPTDGGASLSIKLKCGTVYWMTRGSDGGLKLQPIGTI